MGNRNEYFGENISSSLHPHFMLLPSLACPAKCSYCFGPHQGPVMSPETLKATLDFMARIVMETGQRRVHATFHGGEPLAVGHEFWREALGGIEARFGVGGHKLAIQSNLWFLDDEYCDLFLRHKVAIGTSLDGPECLTDQQRGFGYFAGTMAGIRKAQSRGMAVGCITTFTPLTMSRWREVFDFFLDEKLSFSVHAAVPSGARTSRLCAEVRTERPRYHLTPTEYGALLIQMLDYYVDHRRELSVSSFDQMFRGLGYAEGHVCTFRNCLGMFLAIDPLGDIYPCQRFAGQPQYRLGTLSDEPTFAELMASPVALRMIDRQAQVRYACDGCTHLAYCQGGCVYNARATESECGTAINCAEGDKEDPESLGPPSSSPISAESFGVIDPYCTAYRKVFDHIRQRLLFEMGSDENIKEIAERPHSGSRHFLWRKGPLIELVREGPHPSHMARMAKRIVAAVELAKGPDLPAAAKRLCDKGICRSPQSAEKSLNKLQHDLDLRPNMLYSPSAFEMLIRTDRLAPIDEEVQGEADCPACDLRYLCDRADRHGADSGRPNCARLRTQAKSRAATALRFLEISPEE